jgi:GNAT superfamily N-acetyltransferase
MASSQTRSDQFHEWRNGEFLVSTNRELLDLDVIHGFLTACYWSEGIAREVVARSMEHSLCFGVYAGDQQVGFARAITDFATYAYVADVFVLESSRGHGLGKWLMECIMQHPELQGLRRWNLVTRDAHGLYEKLGFGPPKKPQNYMELHRPDVYQRTASVSEKSSGD